MLSRLAQHSTCGARPQQRQQLTGLWQQQQQQLHVFAQPSQFHADVFEAGSRSMKLHSTLEKLNIQPLHISAEARELTSSPVVPAAVDFHIPPVDTWGQHPFLMSSCEADAAPLRVAVLVSGGVDSSLALKLVTAAGHQATAFYLQIWFQEDFRNFWDACPWEEDLSYAQQVCEALGVPLVVVPLTQQYWDRVVSHSIAEIKQGRTPNPDMLCNSRVKFGAFVEYLQQEHAGSFDRIASGHYARVLRTPTVTPGPQQQQQQQQQQHSSITTHTLASSSSSTGASVASSSTADNTGSTSPDQQALLNRQASHAQASSSSSSSIDSSSSSDSSSVVQLLMVPDAVKDQTYFLSNLSPEQLSHCMFPLGSFTKPQVRALAAAAGLATSGRKDSQGICFLGKVKFGEFVGQHLGEWPGPLVQEGTGQVVGVHDGYWFYTVGQRGGIKLPGGPWYVTRKDMAHNIVYVSSTYYQQERRRDAVVCGPFNWLGDERPQPGMQLFVKVRHGPNMYECNLQQGSRAEVTAVLEQGTPAVFEPLSEQQLTGPSSSNNETDSSSSSLFDGNTERHASSSSSGFWEADSSRQYGVVLLSDNDQGLAAGQYAVFYQQGVCLGSAQILGGVERS